MAIDRDDLLDFIEGEGLKGSQHIDTLLDRLEREQDEDEEGDEED